MRIIINVTYRDFTEKWKVVDFVQKFDATQPTGKREDGPLKKPIGPSPGEMLESLQKELVLAKHVRGYSIWKVSERVGHHHKSYNEDIFEIAEIAERYKNLLGPENTELDSELDSTHSDHLRRITELDSELLDDSKLNISK